MMGTYGYEPRNGDGPHDLYTYVERSAAWTLEALFHGRPDRLDDIWDRLGALQIHLEKLMHVTLETIVCAILDCEHLERSKYSASWDNKEAFVKSLRLMKAALIEIETVAKNRVQTTNKEWRHGGWGSIPLRSSILVSLTDVHRVTLLKLEDSERLKEMRKMVKHFEASSPLKSEEVAETVKKADELIAKHAQPCRCLCCDGWSTDYTKLKKGGVICVKCQEMFARCKEPASDILEDSGKVATKEEMAAQ